MVEGSSSNLKHFFQRKNQLRTIEFHPDGVAFADAKAETAAIEFLTSAVHQHIVVSTANFITAVRALVYEGRCPHDQVEFQFGFWSMSPDRWGRLSDWPNGFCDHMDDLLGRLLDRPYWE